MKKKLASLRERITRNAIVQEGESPSEGVDDLLKQSAGVMQEHMKTAQAINSANQTQKIADGRLLAHVLAERDALVHQHSLIAAAKVMQSEAADQLTRVSSPSSAKILTEDELQRRKFALQSADAQIARYQAQLLAAQAQLAQAETELDVLTIRASRDGRILRLNLREGEYANINPPEPLMVLGDIDTLQIRADVDEQNAPLVESGRAATAYIKGNSTTRLPLTFVRIDPFVVPRKSLTGDSTERVDTRVLQVIFNLKKPDGKMLYVGQQVDVYIETSAPPALVGSPEPPAS